MKHFKKIYVMANDYPDFIFIKNKKYTKFLGSYLPCQLYELTRKQLLELNLIRLELGLVNWDYNKYIINILTKKVNLEKNFILLDFGCGNNFAANYLKSYQYYGIDLNQWKLIKKLKFDAIISSFVFDFNITNKDIRNIYNHLKYKRKFAFNVYKFWDNGRHFNNILNNLKKVGFEYHIEKITVPERFKIRHKKDIIVTCIKE